MAGSALVLSAWAAATHWPGETPAATTAALAEPGTLHALLAEVHPSGHARAYAGAGPLPSPTSAPSAPHHHAGHAGGRHRAHRAHRATAPGSSTILAAPKASRSPAGLPYGNPFRDVGGLLAERIDEGVDFGGSGPVYALGDAVITGATSSNYGWPGGGWITYRLTSGPDAGLQVYLAEDVTPTVQVGQHVTASTVIANMFNGGDGIETGWAQPSGFTAESQLPVAGGIGGSGPFPTMIGLNFEELLQKVGVPAANNRGATPSGLLPSNYPASW